METPIILKSWDFNKSPNKPLNSDWLFRYAPLPAGYAER